jgi:hypothetical protein
MPLHHWLRNLIDFVKSGPPRRPDRQARRSVPRRRPVAWRPAVEALEDRLVPATLSVLDATLIEGNTGVTNALVTVRLSAPSNPPVTVNYSTANDSAFAGSDYQSVSGTLTFLKGQTTKTILVPVTGDTLPESNETFFVNLRNPKHATIADGQAIVTVVDDDPTISVSDMTVTEGNSGTSLGNFTVKLSVAPVQTVTVNYATADGTASDGSDYVAGSGTLTFNPGQMSKTITVSVNGDRLAEPDEHFFVNLTSPSGAVIADGQGGGTIVNDEPLVSVTKVSQPEGDSGTTVFSFTVELSAAPTSGSVFVDYATAGISATAGSDYDAATGTLTFAPGVTSQTISVTVHGDQDLEFDESFVVNLSSGNQAWATIQNDDGILINIGDSSVTEDDYGSSFMEFTIWLSVPSTDTITVDFATSDGTATAGWDYVPTNGTLTFGPGETSQTIRVEVLGDLDYEGDEYFYVNLSNNSGNTLIQQASAVGTIWDNDYYYWGW